MLSTTNYLLARSNTPSLAGRHRRWRYHIWIIERLGVGECPLVTLVVTDSDQDTRHAVRAVGESWGFHHCAAATLGRVLAGGAWARVWQPGGDGFGKVAETVAARLQALVALSGGSVLLAKDFEVTGRDPGCQR